MKDEAAPENKKHHAMPCHAMPCHAKNGWCTAAAKKRGDVELIKRFPSAGSQTSADSSNCLATTHSSIRWHESKVHIVHTSALRFMFALDI